MVSAKADLGSLIGWTTSHTYKEHNDIVEMRNIFPHIITPSETLLSMASRVIKAQILRGIFATFSPEQISIHKMGYDLVLVASCPG